MIIKTNPEFGVELVLTTPYAYHNRDKVETIITSKGMKPFYYWCDDVREEFEHRTIDNNAARDRDWETILTLLQILDWF